MKASCKQSVIVIGGGFAGLAAASELSSHKTIQVTLVEAADYLGGRVKQVRPFKGCQLLDVGGEFIHGEKTTAAKLAKEFSWKIEEIGLEDGVSSTSYAFIDGKLSLLNESNKMFSRSRNVYGQFLSCGRKIRKGLLASEHKSNPYAHNNKVNIESHHKAENQKDLSMKQFIEQRGNVDKSCQKLIDAYYCQSEGNDLDRIGMLEFSRADDVWKYGSSDFRLRDSFSVLVSHFTHKCKTQSVDVHLNWEAKTVSWDGDSPSFVSNKERKRIFGDFILVTVPLQVLKEGMLEFIPDIRPFKKDILDCMEMRSGCKMFCCFTEKFWPLNLQVLYCEQPSTFTQIWTEQSYTNDGRLYHILCGFCTASSAERLSKMHKEDLKDQFLQQLDVIFSCDEKEQPATDSFVDYFFYDWGSNPFIRGCYASPVVNSYAMAEKLAESVNQKLFFAGEATNTRAMSTIQSAIDSGKRAANEIINIINGS